MNSLRTYIAIKNTRKLTFARKTDTVHLFPSDPTRLNPAQQKQLAEHLMGDLSPENLHWDGERDVQDAKKEYDFLKAVEADLLAMGVKVEPW